MRTAANICRYDYCYKMYFSPLDFLSQIHITPHEDNVDDDVISCILFCLMEVVD